MGAHRRATVGCQLVSQALFCKADTRTECDLVGRAHSKVSGDAASKMVQVNGPIRPEMRVEIEAYAVIDEL